MKLVIALRIIAFLVCGGYVGLPIASWIGLWVSGEPISIHWTFWVGLGLSITLLAIAETVKERRKRAKHESQTH